MTAPLVRAVVRHPYLAGLVTAPLVAGVVRPLVRGAVKTTVTLGLQVKKLAAEAREESQDIAAEASADLAAQNGEPRFEARRNEVMARLGPRCPSTFV